MGLDSLIHGLDDEVAPRSSGDSVRVLIVDDHIALVSNVFAYLERRNFVLDAAHDGESAIELARGGDYDVVVLDWMIPKVAGLAVLEALRSLDVDTPVLMLTAKSEVAEKLACFAAGADDYLTKPFSIAELEARILALDARAKGRARVLSVGGLSYHIDTQTVTRDGSVIHLQKGPRSLLRALMKESPNVVAKGRLEALIWGDSKPDRDLLRTHIYELRRSIDGGYAQKYLRTVARVGYRLVDPAVEP